MEYTWLDFYNVLRRERYLDIRTRVLTVLRVLNPKNVEEIHENLHSDSVE